eukprot:1157445-Pelagomonas_calceolata.AAC.14
MMRMSSHYPPPTPLCSPAVTTIRSPPRAAPPRASLSLALGKAWLGGFPALLIRAAEGASRLQHVRGLIPART